MSNPENINETLDHFFRRESGRMVSVLVGIFGSENLELAEDVVQDALVRAMEVWKIRGLPENPQAWLYRTAKNRAIDIIRKNKFSDRFDFSDPKHQLLNSEFSLPTSMDNFWNESTVNDQFLAMMYSCCDKNLSTENQITFILKSLCGFSTKEVARAFLTGEETISKRLLRTKNYFRDHKIKPSITSVNFSNDQNEAVLKAIYLLFNEGYHSTHDDNLIRQDLIAQALYLCKVVTEGELTKSPESFALMALMCFHAARSESRVDQEGLLILLPNQDRRKWNSELIESGKSFMQKSAYGEVVSNYHIEAAISYEHCIASSYEETNWKEILKLYDMLLSHQFDPVVYLNRCLVQMEIESPKEAIEAMKKLENDKSVAKYYLYYAALGELHYRLGENVNAEKALNHALTLNYSEAEKSFLRKKLDIISNNL